MKELFENVNVDDILSFLRRIKLYQKEYKCKPDPYYPKKIFHTIRDEVNKTLKLLGTKKV